MNRFFKLLILGLWTGGNAVLSAPFPLTVLHTNDLHSHFEGTGPDSYFTGKVGDGSPVRGHYARLATAIKTIRAEKSKTGEPVLVVDAGDFYSGTLFHSLAVSSSASVPELEFFGYAGYDAVSFGNHEFDGGPLGIQRLLGKGKKLGLNHRIVASNLLDTEMGLSQTMIKEVSYQGVKLRVGFLGFVGSDALRSSSGTRGEIAFIGYDDKKGKAQFTEITSLASKLALELKSRNQVDIVIALIHGGDPEDLALGKTKGIDLVISGHTHRLYPKPILSGTTWVAQAGSFGRYLGKLELSYENQIFKLRNEGATSIEMNDQILPDAGMLEKIAQYKREIVGITSHLGYRYESPIATLSKNYPAVRESQAPLGIFVTSAVRRELNKRLKDPVDFYFTAASLIREGITPVEGKPTRYQYSDIFRILPLGFDESFRVGAPIKTFYLTKSEVRLLLNFLEIYRHVSANFTPAFSDSVHFRIRKWGIPFVNRIADLELDGKSYEEWPALIHIGTSSYVATFFDKLPALSKGFVRLKPRDKGGNPMAQPSTPEVPVEASLFAAALEQE